MNINDIWNLFKMTGKIEYFLKYRQMKYEGMITIGDSKSKSNSN